MKFVLLVIAFMLTSMTHVQAAVQTDTHTFILSLREDKLLVINKSTGEHGISYISQSPRSIARYENKCVMLTDRALKIYDLGSSKISEVNFKSDTYTMVIQDHLVYIAHYGSFYISVVDLNKYAVVGEIYAGISVADLVVDHTNLYLLNRGYNCIDVINRESHKPVQSISVRKDASSHIILDDFLYVTHENIEELYVINIKTNKTQKLNVCKSLNPMVVHGEYGYISSSQSKLLYVLDLKTHTVLKTIPIDDYPDEMKVCGNFGFVRNKGSANITVIDLTTQSAHVTLDNPNNLTIDFSDTDLYYGVSARLKLSDIEDKKKILSDLDKGDLHLIQGVSFKNEKVDDHPLYEDLLCPMDIADFLLTQAPCDAVHSFLSLYRPHAFLGTKEGARVVNHLRECFYADLCNLNYDRAGQLGPFLVNKQRL